MAQPITWQQVAAPNFSGVADSQRLAGSALNSAFSGFGDAIGKFKDFTESQNAAALLANAASAPDAASLQKMIADGSIYKGVNTQYLTPDAIKTALPGQVSTLLGQALTKADLRYKDTMLPLDAQGKTLANQGQSLLNTQQGQQNTRYGLETPIMVGQAKANLDRLGIDNTKAGTELGWLVQNHNWDQSAYEKAVDAAGHGDLLTGQAYLNSLNLSPEELGRARTLLPGLTGQANTGVGGIIPTIPGLGATPGPGGSAGAKNGAPAALSVAAATGATQAVQNGDIAKDKAPEATSAATNPTVLSAAAMGETQEQLTARIKQVQPSLTNQECVELARKVGGITAGVTDWRRGDNAVQKRLPIGTPVATFLDRNGNPSDRYDGGQGIGVSGNNTTHAGIVAGYDKDGNLQLAEQFDGSGGPHITTYKSGDSRGGEKDANNYFAINGVNGKPLGTNNPLNGASPGVDSSNPYSEADKLQAQHAAYMNAATKAGQDLQQRINQNNSDPITAKFNESEKDNSDFNAIAQQMKNEQGSVFANVDTRMIVNRLQAIKEAFGDVKVSNGTVANVLRKESTSIPGSTFGKFVRGFTGGLLDVGYDDLQTKNSGVTQDVAKIGSSEGAFAQAQSNAQSKILLNTLNAFSDQAQVAYTNLQNARQMAQVNPALAPAIARYKLAYDHAIEQVKNAHNAIENSPGGSQLPQFDLKKDKPPVPVSSDQATKALRAAVAPDQNPEFVGP